ncbi:MAG: type VI secretion system Vgr family protein [Sandaracinaceae bacterium]
MAEPWTVLEATSRASGFDNTVLQVESLRGTAAISEPYRYEVAFTCASPGYDHQDLDELLRAPFSVSWGPTGESVVHGMLDGIRTESIEADQDVRYVAVLEPRLARLRYTTRSRVFQDMTVPEIVQEVLTEHQVPGVHGHFAGSYPKSEYTLQYQESDLDFIQRLMEHHGIHYHFGHDPSDEHEHLFLGDRNAHFTNRGNTVNYERRAVHLDAEALHSLTRSLKLGPATVFLTDYNWRAPRVALSNQTAADNVTGAGLFHEHANHYKTPSEGAALAETRAQQIVSERVRFEATGTLFGVSAGFVVNLADHPHGEYAHRAFVIVRRHLELHGGGSASHQDTYELTDATVEYRPPRRTPKPRIYGVIHGVVDAPAHSTAAPIDSDGRYRVLLPFDLNGRPGGTASRWIRVAQPSSGPGYGFHLPLHLGAEVAIAHLGGDPDRPVIVGSVHNTDTKNPVVEDNATQSWLRTQAGVRILFDDDAS